MNINLLPEEKLHKIIVARQNEIEGVKKQFDRVLEGNLGLTMVTGKPGTGKTFFVEHAINSLYSKDITYLYGKFRQYDNHPLLAIAEV